MGAVVIKDLDKTYFDGKKAVFHAVKGINLEVKDGEFLVLVGPSGCGKSTTLRMIAGLEKITGGTISIDGEVVNDMEPKDRGIAMVFQNYALYPHMSVFENMAFGLRLAKKPKEEIKERVDVAAKILGLEEMLDRKPKALSGGQRQRVAVGRAIVRNPKVFLFDEPLSNLDAKMRVATRTEIAKLHKQLGTTMIYVTHDQVEAMTMGDRICVMKDGNIMQVADPLTLYRQPENTFVASFIGSPPMNLLHGEIVERNGQAVFVETEGDGEGPRVEVTLAEQHKKLRGLAIGKKVVLGIRPENMHAEPEANTQQLDAKVEISEPMGAESFVYMRTHGHTIIARLFGDHIHEIGSQTTVHLNLDRLHFFDAETEQVITE